MITLVTVELRAEGLVVVSMKCLRNNNNVYINKELSLLII